MMTTEPYAEAIGQLQTLMDEAGRRDIAEPFAAALATADRASRPSVRMVSVVAIEEAGLLFFVDVRSGKGWQIVENPRVCLCFFWAELHQQVIVEGEAYVLDEATSDQHWAKRPREFQLAAWIYDPSVGLKGVEPPERLREARHKFENRYVPRPPHWYAVRLRPSALRFWKLGWHRPHARLCYVRDDRGLWRKETIEPF